MVLLDATDSVAERVEPLLAGVLADAQRALEAAGRGESELSVTLTDDAGIAPINLRWRGKSGPTDVLSFPQQTPEYLPIDLLGDIVISVDTAASQARERGHDLRAELRVLLVHGLCHLLGHDHHEPEQAQAMARLERQLLASLGDGPCPDGLVDVALRGNRGGRRG